MVNTVAELKKIQALQVSKVSNGAVKKTFFTSISIYLLELKNLDVNSCSYITDTDLDSIKNLPKLEVLTINWLYNITASGICCLQNLKELHSVGCWNLQDNALINLLKNSSNLEFLDIRKCRKITSNFVIVSVEVTKQRSSNILLEIYIGGTICRKIYS